VELVIAHIQHALVTAQQFAEMCLPASNERFVETPLIEPSPQQVARKLLNVLLTNILQKEQKLTSRKRWVYPNLSQRPESTAACT
jgi:hypothetical protein